jgi:hypothetical protein
MKLLRKIESRHRLGSAGYIGWRSAPSSRGAVPASIELTTALQLGPDVTLEEAYS